MQMLQSDWLNHWTLLAISVQWLGVVLEMTFFRFSKGLEEINFDANEKHMYGFLAFKKVDCWYGRSVW